MPSGVTLTVKGAKVCVPSGATVAVAVAIAGQTCRRSVTGANRAEFCAVWASASNAG
jgi:hypothetical protein